ncbi:MAG: hypothetical protein KBG27_09860 [Flexilinea sp.]|nr:hypothetical protein [Flexilinea sp.]
MKNKHGRVVVVNADRSDWGIHWGIGDPKDEKCWCYDCTMKRLDEKMAKKKGGGK